MILPRHDRIISLANLTSYPGIDFFDRVIFLPLSDDTFRRIWLKIPHSAPSVQFDDIRLEPGKIFHQDQRWIDYGVVELPFLKASNWSGGYFAQLRLIGIDSADCQNSHLVITKQLEISLSGQTLEEAERKMWGLARSEAGSTFLRPDKITSGSPINFEVDYRAGPKGLRSGARVRFSVPNSFSRPQTEYPAEPGYISFQDTDCSLQFESIATSIESHEMVDIICRIDSDIKPGRGFSLRYRTDHTHIFSQNYRGTDREWWFAPLPPLNAATAFPNQSSFVSLCAENSHTFELLPGKAERLHLFLPGRQYESDQVLLKGTYTDRYRNSPPPGPIPVNYDLWLVNGENRRQIGTPSGHFVDRHRFYMPLPNLEPGLYRVYAIQRDSGEEIARSNPLRIITTDDGHPRLYWGEIHAHTEMSDGIGSYSEVFRHARDEGCLDFAGCADHAVNFSDNQWLWMQDVTNGWNDPGRFLTLVGYEWGGKQMHRNIHTSKSCLKLLRGRMLPSSQVNELWNCYSGDNEVVGGGHASLGHGLTWEMHDPEVERYIEIYSMWGASDFLDSPLSPALSPLAKDWDWEIPGVITVNEVLKQGAKLGFTGGGDCHEGHAGFSAEDPCKQGLTPHSAAKALTFRCGMTAATMHNLDRKSLLEALRNRRTYATTGARILLDFHIGEFKMGEIGISENVICSGAVNAVYPLNKVEIIKNGVVAWVLETPELDIDFKWQDPDPTRKESYYYLHVVQQNGEEAWSSPIWIQ